MDVGICIIGAGAIGLAIAKKLSERNTDIFVLEKNNKFGQETSSRNSEVIHSGIYYPNGSLKAKLCLEGNRLIYDYAIKKGIAFNKCGKLIVATEASETQKLLQLHQNGLLNGVSYMELMDPDGISSIEPNVKAVKAIYIPQTGIIDSHDLMKHYLTDAMAHNCEISYQSKVTGLKKIQGGYMVSVEDGSGEPFSFSTSIVINAAGLESSNIARLTGSWSPEYSLHYCKGEYFRVNPPKNRYINRLVYPIPPEKQENLGVHATIELGGGMKLGPNSIYLNRNVYDYSVDPMHLKDFYHAGHKFLPFLSPEDLTPEMAGIRPKLQLKGEAAKDFIIKNEYEKGFCNFINLIGIESPGLTASLAIANYVESIIH